LCRLFEKVGTGERFLREWFDDLCGPSGFFQGKILPTPIDLIDFRHAGVEIREIYEVDVRSMEKIDSCFGASRRCQ
jgi:hypothetical protein